MLPLPVALEVAAERRLYAQSSAFRSAINSETLLNEVRRPARASFIAAVVVAFGTFRSNGNAFSAATRVSKTRTA